MAPSSSRWVAPNKTHDQLVRHRIETGSQALLRLGCRRSPPRSPSRCTWPSCPPGTASRPTSLLGLDLVRDAGKAPASLNAGTQGLLDQHEAPRTGKDFTGLDRLRDELAAMGVLVKDTPAGQ